MNTSMPRRFKGKVRDDYLDLVMAFPLTSIRSDDDLEAAQEVMDRLLSKGDLSSGDELYLDALSDLDLERQETLQPTNYREAGKLL